MPSSGRASIRSPSRLADSSRRSRASIASTRAGHSWGGTHRSTCRTRTSAGILGLFRPTRARSVLYASDCSTAGPVFRDRVGHRVGSSWVFRRVEGTVRRIISVRGRERHGPLVRRASSGVLQSLPPARSTMLESRRARTDAAERGAGHGDRRTDRGQERLSARLPRHVQHAGDGRGRRRGRLAGGPRAPVHAGVPLQEDEPLPRSRLRRRPAHAPAPAGRGEGGRPVRADRLGRGAGGDRRSVRRDRAVGRRPAGDPAVQLLRDDGQAPGEQPRPAVLPPPRGLEARPDHLRLGGLARVRVHRRPWAVGADPMGVASCRFLVNWGSNTVNTNSHLWSRMVAARSAARRSSRSTPTGARPPRSPTGTSPPAPAPTPPWRSASCTSSGAKGCKTTTTWRRGRIGAPLLHDRVLNDYPLDRVAAITGVDAATIAAFARRYARESPPSSA